MVKLIVVSKIQDGFAIRDFTVKSMDMKEIASQFPKQVSAWGFNVDDCEIFRQSPSTKSWYWVARRTGRGWTRVAATVKNWDKYSSPSWVKKVKSAGIR